MIKLLKSSNRKQATLQAVRINNQGAPLLGLAKSICYDTGHIGIHGGVDVRTYVRTIDDVMAKKNKISPINGLSRFLNYVAPLGVAMRLS